MAGSCKRNCVDHGKKDIISDLPRELIHSMLEHLPIRDAARTSILSRKWRYIWASHPKIVVDKNFFTQKMMEEAFRHEFVSIITKILLLHDGPVRKFFLHIPYFSFDIGQWMLFLSRNGVNDLTLDNSCSNPYVLPSYVFSCPELRVLKLRNFIIKPPHTFGVFANLIHCFFEKISFAADLFGALVPSALQLESLRFTDCNGISNFNINVPKLRVLYAACCNEVNLMLYSSTRNLANVSFSSLREVGNPKQSDTIDLIKLIGYWPRIQTILFDGCILKFLAAGTVPKRLPLAIGNLACLSLWKFVINDVDQISCAFCLLRSSPNLRGVEIYVSKAGVVADSALGPVLNYLEAPDCMDQTLDKLRTVRVYPINGSIVELLLIKILLACSPLLEKMFVELSPEVDASEGFRISKELMRFPRASPKAELVLGTYIAPVAKDRFLETKIVF